MLSDCGNEINSVKFKVWLQDNSRGILEVAFHNKGLPEGTTRKDWTREFDSFNNMVGLMDSLRRKLRSKEGFSTERRIYCIKCNTVTITKINKNIETSYIADRCGYCGTVCELRVMP